MSEPARGAAEEGSRAPPDSPSSASPPSFAAALRVWLRVAALSFGGPAGQIAVMERILVEEKGWVSRERFLHALSYCMLLPGPEAQQLATYVGWLLFRIRGGLAAGVLFILPGFVSILALSVLYAGYRELGWVEGLFAGLGPAVVAIVAQALVRISRRALVGTAQLAIAIGSLVAMALLRVPFPVVIVAAALVGLLLGRLRRGASAPEHAARRQTPAPTWRRALVVLAIGLLVWWLPVGALAVGFGGESVFVEQALFFSKAAMVTFGGAYAVLAYVAQRGVEDFGWLEPGEMLDGLAMAETTPGPLIQVVQFVGYLGAAGDPGPLSPLAAGVLGSVVTTWVTFVPCFLWIFLGAPWVEWLRGVRPLSDALGAITAATVGVIANLALWFATHTLFGATTELASGPFRLLVPVAASLDLVALAIAVAAAVALLLLRAGMLSTLTLAAGAGIVLRYLGE